MIFASSYAVQASSFQTYQRGVHLERAQLYAQETFEQVEAIRLSRRQQQYQRSWETFMGSLSDGIYQILKGSQMNEWTLSLSGTVLDEELSVREYNHIGSESIENGDGLYSRLERRIFLENGEDNSRLLTVSVFWGLPGTYRDDHIDQIRLQMRYQDQVGPAFVL